MKLVLDQKTWKEIDGEAAEGAERPHIVLLPLVPWDEALAARRKAVLEWDVPAAATVTVVSEELTKSSVDWVMRVIEARLMRGDEVIEVRLGTFYVMLEYWAGAMWRGPLDTYTAHQAEILAGLSSGRPDWSRREIIALYQLYESA
jgi:hypothetical protein